ncbi:MAG TPA: hypothetical protein PK359_15045 [Burkholderiaceae bacterium]|nr:hypothetical protein [Burkholderiaceae bacterium]
MDESLPDVLHHLGRRFALVERPLDAYFNLIGERPRLKMPSATLDVPYRARWAIEDGWFYLISLEGHWHDGAMLRMHQMFPFAGPKVFAAWMSGTLHGYREETATMPDLESPTLRRYPDLVLTLHCGRVASSGSPAEIRTQVSTRLALNRQRDALHAASVERTAHENMTTV